MSKKGTLAWKKDKYSQACRILDYINKQGNFCNIQKKNGCVTCANSAMKTNSLCCGGCENLTKNGCKAQSLSCKINFCYFGTGPEWNGLVKTNHHKIWSEKRAKFITILYEFLSINKIPIIEDRCGKKQTFVYHKQELENE